MPILTGIYIYPIKSCAAVALNEARLVKRGLALDRHWMLVDATGRFVSQREYPALAVVSPQPTDRGLHITAPGHAALRVDDAPSEDTGASRMVTVWSDSLPARDAGDEAAEWFSDYLGTPLRLVRFDNAVTRLASQKWTDGEEAPTQFSDGFPFLVTNEGSLEELNGRLQAKGAPSITMDRFRPNLVISGVEAYEEDHVASITISTPGTASDDIILRFVKPCARCPIPTIEQSTGLRDAQWPHEPLDTLAQYRADARVNGGLTFGQNAILASGVGALLRKGANVEVELDFPD